MVVKNCHQQNVLKETTLRFFACLATADSFSISFFANQRLKSYYKKKKKTKRTQIKFETKLNCSSAHINDLELKTYEKNI